MALAGTALSRAVLAEQRRRRSCASAVKNKAAHCAGADGGAHRGSVGAPEAEDTESAGLSHCVYGSRVSPCRLIPVMMWDESMIMTRWASAIADYGRCNPGTGGPNLAYRDALHQERGGRMTQSPAQPENAVILERGISDAVARTVTAIRRR
jgi:hypothetical protein